MKPFEHASRIRLVCGPGTLSRLGELARELGFRRTLVVSDPGIVRAGYAARASAALETAGVTPYLFSGFDHDPTSAMVEAGVAAARAAEVDSLVGLGGGSSMDCAKSIGFLLANGGHMPDYRGYAKARTPLPPMIGIPTTAGTGSEAQSYALVSDDATHEKMACGDPSAAFRVALLDAELLLSLPRAITAVTGYDAIAHSVETWVTSARTPVSDLYAREAFRLLDAHYPRVLEAPGDLEARGATLLAAHWAGAAIEASMLGATHACANPLTARYGTTHGVAIALLLPHVVRWNGAVAEARYAELLAAAGRRAVPGQAAAALAARLEELARLAGLPHRLMDVGVPEADLPALAAEAAEQWTGRYNPRPFDGPAAQELYR
ncbi:MAG TPA: iron-containing alcohol dehydrogenase, partial [Vicinamibacteria bacterium]